MQLVHIGVAGNYLMSRTSPLVRALLYGPVAMKKKVTKQVKKLKINRQKVRDLTPVNNDRLEQVQGGATPSDSPWCHIPRG